MLTRGVPYSQVQTRAYSMGLVVLECAFEGRLWYRSPFLACRVPM